MTTFMNLFKKHKVASSLAAIIIIILGIGYSFRTKDVQYETAIAAKKDVIKEIALTGKVKSARNADLGFEQSGRIAGVYVQEGSRVVAGTVLAREESGTIAADLDQAKSAVLSAQASLAELRRGARPEEIEVDKKKVESAKVDLSEAVRSLAATLQDSYSSADDAVRNRADKLYEGQETQNPRILFSTSNSALKSELESKRVSLSAMFTQWKKDLSGDLSSQDNVALIAASSESHLADVRDFLDKLSLLLTYAITAGNTTQTTIDGYRADVSAARANVSTALTALQGDRQSLQKSIAALSLAQASLSLAQAPSTPEQISKGEAALGEAKARLENTQAQAAKYALVSPISGTVTAVHLKSGEIASPGTPVVSLISDSALQIEAFVPETDIALVHTGSVARVTLDAYGSNEVWDAKVLSVDPAETLIDGVSTYKTLLEFSNSRDERIKSGMTANVEIVAQKKEAALSLPRRFISEKDGKYTVLTQDANGVVSEKELKIGITGSDGSVEIISGVSEGETVVLEKK